MATFYSSILSTLAQGDQLEYMSRMSCGVFVQFHSLFIVDLRIHFVIWFNSPNRLY